MCARVMVAVAAASVLMTMVIGFDCAYIHKREYNGYMQARAGVEKVKIKERMKNRREGPNLWAPEKITELTAPITCKVGYPFS